jgi:positive regulator of sigma E activity
MEFVMREEGTVLAVEKGMAQVRLVPTHDCDSCCACAALKQDHVVSVPAIEGLGVGDRVAVEVSVANATAGALLVFVLPLLGLVGGVIAGTRWRPFKLSGNADGLVLGILLLVLLFVLAIAAERLVIRRKLADPILIEIISRNTTG